MVDRVYYWVSAIKPKSEIPCYKAQTICRSRSLSNKDWSKIYLLNSKSFVQNFKSACQFLHRYLESVM